MRELSDAEREAMVNAWESRGCPCVDAIEILECGWLASRDYLKETERLAGELQQAEARERALREALISPPKTALDAAIEAVLKTELDEAVHRLFSYYERASRAAYGACVREILDALDVAAPVTKEEARDVE